MSKFQIPLIGGGTPAKAVSLNPSNLINLYPLVMDNANDGSKVPKALYATPGTNLYLEGPTSDPIRGMVELNNQIYFVSGYTVYSVGTSNVFTTLGTLSTNTGRVNIVVGRDQLAFLDGVAAYSYTISTETFAAISDGDFYPTATEAVYHHDRLVYIQPDSDVFLVSDVGDITSYDALNTATAEYDPQNLVAIAAVRDDIYLFGREGTEIWTITSDSTFPYTKRPYGTFSYGCIAPKSVQVIADTPIWLSRNKNGNAYLMTTSMVGYSTIVAQVITDEHATYQLSQMTRFDDAIGEILDVSGHLFYVLTFPTDNKSFIYDIKTKQLTQFASWYIANYDSNGNPQYKLGRTINDHIINFDNKVISSDYRLGRFLEISPDYTTDYDCGYDNTIYRECITPIISNQNQRLIVDAIEIDCETGDPVNIDYLSSSTVISNDFTQILTTTSTAIAASTIHVDSLVDVTAGQFIGLTTGGGAIEWHTISSTDTTALTVVDLVLATPITDGITVGTVIQSSQVPAGVGTVLSVTDTTHIRVQVTSNSFTAGYSIVKSGGSTTYVLTSVTSVPDQYDSTITIADTIVNTIASGATCYVGDTSSLTSTITNTISLSQNRMSIALSKDKGHTFTSPREADFGEIGEYSKRVRFLKWGMFRNGAVKIATNSTGFIALHKMLMDVRVAEG